MQIEGDSVQIKAKGGAVRVSDRARTGVVVGAKTADKTPKTGKKPTPKSLTAAQGSDCKFKCAMKYLNRAEGGYTVDNGGPTMFGVTQDDYRTFLKQHRKQYGNDPEWPDLTHHAEDMKRLTYPHAVEIYRSMYWDDDYEALPLPLGMCCFDAKVQSGPHYHTRAITARSMGLPANTSWADIHKAASQATPTEVSAYADNFLQERLKFYVGLATGKNAAIHRGSMQGWANRIGLPNPLASAKADKRSKQRYGNGGFKEYLHNLKDHCKGCS